MSKLRLIEKNKYPSRLSPIALTFEAEIKRVAEDKGLSIDATMSALAGFTGISVAQLYNYRTGRTPMPADHIPVFCKQFESNALAMTVLNMCNETPIEEREALDLARFCSSATRDTLKGGEEFMTIMQDGKVDGHEEKRFSEIAAKMVRNTNRKLEIVRATRQRSLVRFSPPPAAA